MNKALFFLLAWLLGACAHPVTQAQSVPSAARTEPFAFKGSYDADEIYRKGGLYYTRIGSYSYKNQDFEYIVNTPQKMQGTFYIFTRGKPTSDGEGTELGFSHGTFIDGRKDGPWVYVTFATPNITVREEYRMGKLVSRKPGPPYPDAP